MRISKFIQTPFVSYNNKNLVYIGVEDWDYCNPYEVIIFIDGDKVYNDRVFATENSVYVPCYESDKNVTVKLVSLSILILHIKIDLIAVMSLPKLKSLTFMRDLLLTL